jgi:hypothetical protein
MPTYIVRAGDTDFVKIGRADDVADRMAELQTSNPEPLILLRVVDAHFETETAFHARFADSRVQGEWFRFDPDMLTYIPDAPRASKAKRRAPKSARKAARDEACDLIAEVHRSFRLFESRGAFQRRLARLLGIGNRRAKALMYGEARRVEIEEIEGLRRLAARLRREVRTSDAASLPFEDCAALPRKES